MRDARRANSGLDAHEHAGLVLDDIASRVHFHDAATLQVPVVENFYAYKTDPARHATLLHRLQRHRPTVAPRAARKFTRRLIALIADTVSQLTPTRIELLASDVDVIKTVRRPWPPAREPDRRLPFPRPCRQRDDRDVAINAAILGHAPDDGVALNRLGRAYEALGSIELAEQTFRRALAADPSNAIATQRLRDLARGKRG